MGRSAEQAELWTAAWTHCRHGTLLAMTTRQEPPVFTTDDALRAGFTLWQVRRRVATGRWTALRPGVMVSTEELASLAGRSRHAVEVRAAMLALNRRWASSRSVARLLDLPIVWGGSNDAPSVVDLTAVPGGRGPRRYPDVIVQVAAVPSSHATTLAGLPATTAARTAVDLSRHLAAAEALPTVDAILHRRLASPEAIAAVARRCHRWPGIARARRTLALSDGRHESALESLSAFSIRRLGLPEPVPQVVVLDQNGVQVARVDFAWPSPGIVGEADGRTKYSEGGDAGALWAEKRREDRLRDLGLEVVRWRWREAVHRPDVLGARLEGARRRAAARGQGAVTAQFARPNMRIGADLLCLYPTPASKVSGNVQSEDGEVRGAA